MGILDKLFRQKTKEEEKIEKKVEEIQTKGIDVNAPLIENEITCNACGGIVDGIPKFLNHQGKRMAFHKKCLKKLKKGNIQF